MVASADKLDFWIAGDDVPVDPFWPEFMLYDQLAQRYGKFPHEVREQMDPIDIWAVQISESKRQDARDFENTAEEAKNL